MMDGKCSRLSCKLYNKIVIKNHKKKNFLGWWGWHF